MSRNDRMEGVACVLSSTSEELFHRLILKTMLSCSHLSLWQTAILVLPCTKHSASTLAVSNRCKVNSIPPAIAQIFKPFSPVFQGNPFTRKYKTYYLCILIQMSGCVSPFRTALSLFCLPSTCRQTSPLLSPNHLLPSTLSHHPHLLCLIRTPFVLSPAAFSVPLLSLYIPPRANHLLLTPPR